LGLFFITFPLEKNRMIGYVFEIQGFRNPWIHFVRALKIPLLSDFKDFKNDFTDYIDIEISWPL